MKICENCGMEYGDDNSFCPFCDERYGVVILADDVISADGLPAYKEEFPVIGETGVKQESFAANRDKIYKRNIRLAARENFLPKMEVRAAYKPVVPLAEIGRGGAISPYKPPNPIVQKLGNVRKNLIAKQRKVLSKTGKWRLIGFTSALLLLAVIIGISWADYDANIQSAEIVVTEPTIYAVESRSVSMPEDVIITGESGLEMKLSNGTEREVLSTTKNGDVIGTESIEYEFEYEFTNTTDQDIARFWDDFTNYDILELSVYSVGDGNANYRSEYLWMTSVGGVMRAERDCIVHAGETATGVVSIEYNDHFNLDLTKH